MLGFSTTSEIYTQAYSYPKQATHKKSQAIDVTVRVFVMLDIYFVSVKYVFVTVKLVCVCVKFLKI
jgi:hypothetical protein